MTLGGRRFLLVVAVVAASLTLALGISLPFVRLTKFMLYTYEHSLIAAVSVLTRSGQYFLGVAVLVFAIFLPVLRLLYLLLLALLPLRDIDRLARQLRALEWLGLCRACAGDSQFQGQILRLVDRFLGELREGVADPEVEAALERGAALALGGVYAEIFSEWGV